MFKRSSKIHKRTRSTLKQFIKTFSKCLQTNQNVGGKISEDKLEFISKIPEISIHSIVKFMVSEHIIGSFMNNEDRVQDIFNGKLWRTVKNHGLLLFRYFRNFNFTV